MGNHIITSILILQLQKSVKAAADDLKLYINKASGLSLKIVSGDRIPSGNYISIGSTTALKALGINTTGIFSRSVPFYEGRIFFCSIIIYINYCT